MESNLSKGPEVIAVSHLYLSLFSAVVIIFLLYLSDDLHVSSPHVLKPVHFSTLPSVLGALLILHLYLKLITFCMLCWT